MDVVYVFKNGKRKSIELRYSLMFLANLPHDRVFIVWDLPPFVKDVIHIPFKDWANRIQNVKNKYKLIIENEDISDDFILMHDDVYAIHQIQEIKPHIRCTLQEHLDIIEEKIWMYWYYKHIEAVKDRFPKWLSYETHTPAVFNKQKFKYILDKYEWLWATKSLYYNHYWIEWIRLPEDRQDCKIYNQQDISKQMLKLPYISSDDAIVWNDKFWELLDIKLMNISKARRMKYLVY